jgi:hypothetical protein
MTNTALQALKGSIKHWEELAAGYGGVFNTPSSPYCPLCKHFIRDVCRGCPVREKTQAPLCQNSPFSSIQSMWDKDLITPKNDYKYLKSKVFKAAAKKELEFLESLLPENVQKENLRNIVDTLHSVERAVADLKKSVEEALISFE